MACKSNRKRSCPSGLLLLQLVRLFQRFIGSIFIFSVDMVTSCGVAARALNALAMAGIEVLLITTSDLDISLLVHAENEDAAYEALKKAYEL